MALVGLMLFCQACGRVEISSPVSTVRDQSSVPVIGSDTATLSEGKFETLEVGDTSYSSGEPDITDLSERASETENAPLGVMARRPVSYLEEVIPPCVSLEGSEQDTCPRITLSRARSSTGVTTTLFRELPSRELPTFTDSLMGSISGGLFTPHIVVRATIKPDTTRCNVYPLSPFDYDISREDTWWYNGFVNYSCFMEARVNEYMVGEGPPELTVIVYSRALDKSYIEDDYTVSEGDEYEAHLRMSGYPGKEVVMMLGPAWTTAVEAWNIQPVYHSLWFVQRNGDEVRAVSEDTNDTDNPELLSQMNLSLDELVRKIKEAAEERLVLTGGRIGVDASLPMLITDANKLQNFYQNTGAVYEGENATVLPPPVPGGEEPEQPPTRTGEEQPDTTTIPAPGDETSPTPTDDASPPSTTTTMTLPQTEDTSTTTTVITPTSTTLPQTEDTLPVTTTTTVPVPTGTTLPQAEDTATTTASTTAAPSDDTTGTTLPQVEDPVPTTTGTTVGPTPTSTGTVQPPGNGEPDEPQADDTDPAPTGTAPPPPDDKTVTPSGGDGPGIGAG